MLNGIYVHKKVYHSLKCSKHTVDAESMCGNSQYITPAGVFSVLVPVPKLNNSLYYSLNNSKKGFPVIIKLNFIAVPKVYFFDGASNSSTRTPLIVNPRRACAARVMVVGSVCVCVCVCVCVPVNPPTHFTMVCLSQKRCYALIG